MAIGMPFVVTKDGKWKSTTLQMQYTCISTRYVCVMEVSIVSLYGHVWSADNSVHILQPCLYTS